MEATARRGSADRLTTAMLTTVFALKITVYVTLHRPLPLPPPLSLATPHGSKNSPMPTLLIGLFVV